jgi:hypothetical protein
MPVDTGHDIPAFAIDPLDFLGVALIEGVWSRKKPLKLV